LFNSVPDVLSMHGRHSAPGVDWRLDEGSGGRAEIGAANARRRHRDGLHRGAADAHAELVRVGLPLAKADPQGK